MNDAESATEWNAATKKETPSQERRRFSMNPASNDAVSHDAAGIRTNQRRTTGGILNSSHAGVRFEVSVVWFQM